MELVYETQLILILYFLKTQCKILLLFLSNILKPYNSKQGSCWIINMNK